MDLPEGEHEYKFYVDGQWVLNPQDVSVLYTLQNKWWWVVVAKRKNNQ